MSNDDHDRLIRVAANWYGLYNELFVKAQRLTDENERLRHEAERDAAILAAFQAGSVKQTDEILALREALAEAIQSLEEWGAAEELAVGIARWRVVLGGGNE